MGPYEDPDELYSLDVVTRAGTGSWVVGTKMTKQWGVVQYREPLHQCCSLSL